MHSFHPEETQFIKIDNYTEEQLDQLVDESMILVNGICQDAEFIEKALTYEAIWRSNELNEVEKEEKCWLDELQLQHAINMERWREIEEKVIKENQLYPPRDQTQ